LEIEAALHDGRRGLLEDPDVPQEDHLVDTVGMAFRVSEGQQAPPGTAHDKPSIDLEMPTETFDVVDEMQRRVGREVDVRLARVRRAPSAPR
jgi:hypothetical protein